MKTQTLCKNISKKLVLLAGLCMTAAGCSSAPASSTTSSTAHSATAKTADGTVYENYGRTITIDHVPEKVLTFGPNCTELFAALGLQDKIIGTTLNNHSRGPLPEYADALADVPQLNYGSASREAVMGSGADFIYGIDWEFGEEGVRLDELDAFGMNAYVSSAKTLDEVYKEIEDLGKIFGIEEKASDLIAEQKERLADVEAKIDGADPVDVLVYDSGSAGIFTASGANYETKLLEAAGMHNVFDDLQDREWVTVSAEEAVERNPQVIVIHDYDSPSLEAKIEQIRSDPALSQLEAVQKERFIPISLESILPGIRLAYSVESLHDGLTKVMPSSKS